MSGWVFADTSSLIAYFAFDEAHLTAFRTLDEILRSRRRLLTTTDVFDEVVTWVRSKAGCAPAVRIGEVLRTSTLTKLVDIDDSLRERAWQLFRKHKIPKLSLTDCTSFAVMEKFYIKEAFTFDEDFSKAGFSILPGKS